MLRTLYFLGATYLGLCAWLLATQGRPEASILPLPAHPTVHFAGSAGEWFATVKPYCNSVEVATRLQYSPPPATPEGAGYAAACYALAGNIDAARTLIEGLGSRARGGAANIVFNVGHPVADAGDDKSAGPIMELVLEFWPENYMALYHAGMSEYVLGQPARARANLEKFLELYRADDGWRSNAIEVLARLGLAQ